MAGDKKTLKFLLALQTAEFKKGLNSVKRQLGSFKGFMKSAFALGSITMFGKQMVQAGKDFEDAMARVKAVSNATTEDFKAMEKEARKLGSTTIYSAQEAAGALENLTRNGMTAKQATASLAGVLKLAQANAIGLAESADIVTNTLNMFGLNVSEVSRVNDVLSTTASHTATNVTLLYDALVNAAPVAKVMGYNLEEVSAILGALANKGVKGAEAGTQLRMALVKMSDPLIVEKLQEMGVAIDENTLKSKDLKYVLGLLKDAGLSFGQLVHAFSQKGAAGIQQMINSYDSFLQVLEHTTNAQGTADRMFKDGVGSVRKEIELLKKQYNDLLISISNQTGGIVKFVVKELRNIVSTLKTNIGQIMYVASFLVPLLTKNFEKLKAQMIILFKTMKTEGAIATATMSGWISAIATLITWIGTALVTAWNKNTEAMRNAKKEMAEASVSVNKLTAKTKSLLDQLQPETDKKSLAGIVDELCNLFPDFASAIREAANEAGKTNNYDKLKQSLMEIAELQSSIITSKAHQGLINANAEIIGRKISSTRIPVGLVDTPYGPQHQYTSNPFSTAINDELKRIYGKEMAKKMKESLYKTIGEIIGNAGGDTLLAGKEINLFLKNLGVNLNTVELLKKYNLSEYNNQYGYAVRDLMSGKERGMTAEELVKKRIEGDAFASMWLNSFNGEYKGKDTSIWGLIKQELENIRKSTDEINKANKVPNQITGTTTIDDNIYTNPVVSPKELEGDLKTLSDIIKDYDAEVQKLNNQKNAGSITQEEYATALDDVENDTWKAITALSGFRDILVQLGLLAKGEEVQTAFKTNKSQEASEAKAKELKELAKYAAPVKQTRNTEFDYTKTAAEIKGEEVKIEFDYTESLQNLVTDLEDAIANKDFKIVGDDAVAQLNKLKKLLADASSGATTLQHSMNLSEAIDTLNKQIKDLQDNLSGTITNLAQAFERTFNALVSIGEAFGKTMDEDKKEQWESFFSVLNGGIQIMESVKTIMEAVQLVEDIAAKKKALNAAKEVAANAAVTTSEGTKAAASTAAAAAGAGSSVAGIPILGPALAVGAIATVIAAIIAATKKAKFATGGIVGGNSFTGDKVNAGLNSGEMVLNRAQQATLWNLINGKGNGDKTVELKVRGSDLVGCLNNYGKYKSK